METDSGCKEFKKIIILLTLQVFKTKVFHRINFNITFKRLIMNPHFIAHEPTDTVGVVVVEIVKAGQEVTGWIMESDKTEKLKALAEVPLGHKLALTDIKNGDTIIKYGNDIGRAIEDIPRGGYVHVHNVKTKRW